MELVINKIKIQPDALSILSKLHDDSDGRYLSSMEKNGNDVVCQCPFHKGGQERKMACFVYDSTDGDIEFGTYHCFACGATGHLNKMVSFCLSLGIDDANDWLTEQFGTTYVSEVEYIEEFEFGKRKDDTNVLNEEVLEEFDYNNQDAIDYLVNERHLSKDVVDYFRIGYNNSTGSVTFPCRDLSGNLVGIYERSIFNKHFHIPKMSTKPVYLLYENVQMGSSSIYIAESQINALTLFSWGYPAVALFGTGSKTQYEDLKKSGIRRMCCVFDGDSAGQNGLKKFIDNMSDTVLITYKILPNGKDVNDLTKGEFDEIPTYFAQ